MAYSVKGLSATTLYELFQAHVGPTAARVKLNGIGSLLQSPGAAYYSPSVLGRLLPLFRAMVAQDAQAPIDTVGIGQLITMGVGLSPYLVTGASGNTFDAYWAAKTELGVLSDVGIVATMNKGVIALDGITAMQDTPAVARCRAIPIWEGTNDPWVFNDVASLATACGTLSTEDECWVFGGVTIEGVTINLATGFSFINLPFVTLRAGGDPYPRYGYVDHGPAGFVIPLQVPTPLADLGIQGLTGFGTRTTPPLPETSAVFRLLRLAANGTRKAVGNGDIVITVNSGSLRVDGVSGGPGGHLATQLMLDPFADGTATGITFVRNADI